jgi:hypothetical protein
MEAHVRRTISIDRRIDSPIGRWDEDVFVSRFRVGETVAGTPMPWGAYARMNDEDLRSVYRYLRSLPPVEHETGAPLQEK